MAEVNVFHFCPGNSFIHRADPRFKIGSLALLSIAVAAGKNAAAFSVMTLLIGVSFVFSGLRWQRLFHELRLLGLFMVVILGVDAFNLPGRPVFPYFPVPTAEGLWCGLYFVWKLVLVLALGILFTGTTPPERLSEAVGSILRPLPWIRGARVAVMIGLIFGLVPLVLDQAAEMLEAQSARNAAQRKNPIYRLRYLAIPLLAKIIGRAGQLAEAMEARCFSESRTGAGFKAAFPDWLLLCCSIVICWLIIWL